MVPFVGKWSGAAPVGCPCRTYTGAYVYGWRPVDPRRKQAGRPDTGRVVAPVEEWLVLLQDRLPAYMTWEQYEANLARLQANRARAETLGVAREGPALLTRLVICAQWRRRMAVSMQVKRGIIHMSAGGCGSTMGRSSASIWLGQASMRL